MTTQTQTKTTKRGEAGNVLFLILIAVALFAALSYAVTQSTRSGGGDASKEKSLVSSAALTQYPASLKTAITRMNISGGVDIGNLNFAKPGTTIYTNLVNDATATSSTAQNVRTKNAVFHPEGGGALYTEAPKDVVTLSTNGPWIFNANNEVENIGTTSSTTSVTASTADLMAILPDVTKSICDKIHEQLGINKTTYSTAALNLTNMDTTTSGILSATGGVKVVNPSGVTDGVSGQPQGCVLLSAGRYAYYHVLLER